MTNTLKQIANNIATELNIVPDQLIKLIPDKLINITIRKEQIEKINKLIKSDNKINDFGKTNKLSDNFNNLKISLGNLQMLALIKNLEKADNCEDVLNTFIELMNNKIEQVNKILNTNLQSGGGQKNYYKKYIKYKIKYLFKKKCIRYNI